MWRGRDHAGLLGPKGSYQASQGPVELVVSDVERSKKVEKLKTFERFCESLYLRFNSSKSLALQFNNHFNLCHVSEDSLCHSDLVNSVGIVTCKKMHINF